MADGHVRISIEVDGKKVEYAAKELDNLESAGHRGGKGAKAAEEGMKGVDRESSKAGSSVKKFAASLGLVAIGATAFKVLRASMDAAISRFDTMNKFPKVLQALGVSAEDSERATQKLADGIDGLPTLLNDVALTAQQMYTSFGDMDKAADSALALNNALLGSGSSAEQASRGTQMYLKALQTGQIDMNTWTTLSETMDVGLVKIAETFGYVGKTAKGDLRKALQDGTITLEEFNDALIEVGTGTGIMAELARENTKGLATSFANLRTSVARGIVLVLDSFNELSKNVTGRELADNIEGLKHVVFGAFQVIAKIIDASTPVVKLFALALKGLMPILSALTPLIAGLAAAYLSLLIINKVSAGITILTGVFKAGTVAVVAKTAALTALRAVMTALSGPFGWVAAGIGAVVGGAIAVVKWFNRTSKEAERLNKEVDELGDSIDELDDSIESSAKAYENNIDQIETNAEVTKDLARQIDELSQKENKSAADKKLLQSYVDDLNGSIEGLNLVYGEQSDALNMTSEELQKRIELMQEEEKMIASQERLKETIQEQIEIQDKLVEINELREEWNEKLEDGSVKTREHKKALEELEEQEEQLKVAQVEATEERIAANDALEESSERVAELTEELIDKQIILYEELSDAQKQAVDDMKGTWEEYKDHATDMFDTLSDETTMTVEEMQKNLEENQRIIGEWADGIAELAERGVDQGLLDKLREAGPESAGHVLALVNASDDELAKLSDVFSEGGQTAKDALAKAFEIDNDVLKSVEHLVVNTEKSLREQVKSADFEGIGKDVADGLAEGVEGGTQSAEKASQDMAKAVSDATADELGIQSPSKVFKDYGKDVTDGMELGISDGTNKVIQTAENMLKSMVSEFSSTYSEFNKIGQDAMSGLNAGLSAGRGRVMATARSIANQAAATMKRALEIRSPSMLFRREIGEMLPAGLVLGIEDGEKGIYDTIKRMSQRMVEHVSPSVAFSANMAGSHATSAPINQNTTTNTHNNVNMDGLFSGAVFNVRDEQDIPKLAKELNDYMRQSARSKGVVML